MAIAQASERERTGGTKKKLPPLIKVTTPKFRVAFPHVFEPHAFNEDDKEKYMVAMLFDKKLDISVIKKAAFEAARGKWGPKENWPKGLEWPWKDGDEKKDLKGYKGHYVINAKSKHRPGVIDQTKSPIDKDDSEGFYAGCYARATILLLAYEQGRNKGVSCILCNLQKLGDGEHFGGRKSAEEDFDSVGEVGDEDNAENYDEDSGDFDS